MNEVTERVSYNEYRLSLIISCLLEKLELKEITINLKEAVDISTPVLLVSDVNDEGSIVKLQNLSKEDADKQIEVFKKAQGNSFQ